jgi:hypothetical protein
LSSFQGICTKLDRSFGKKISILKGGNYFNY